MCIGPSPLYKPSHCRFGTYRWHDRQWSVLIFQESIPLFALTPIELFHSHFLNNKGFFFFSEHFKAVSLCQTRFTIISFQVREEYRCPLAVTCDCGCGFGCQVSGLAVDVSVEEFGLFGFS